MKNTIFKIIIAVIIILSMAIPAYAAKDFPDMKNHWAADHVKILTEKGIIDGRGDGLFYPEEPVLVNEYIKMVVTALGYTDIENYPGDWARNYIEKAKELGLIFDGEIADYYEPINRGMMARIAIRALKDESVPEYIEAYKGMVLDYEQIPEDLRLDILKCIEKGILKGMPDNTFKIEANSTRAQAATVIHRMISQEEREKAKPMFAQVDPEFEAIINGPEADKYINLEHLEYYSDGKIAISTWDDYTEKLLLPVGYYPNINKDVYNVLAALAKKAKQYDGYVRVINSTDRDCVQIEYFSQKSRGEGFTQGFSEFGIMISPVEQYNEDYFPEMKGYCITLIVNSLWPSKYERETQWDYLHPSMPDIIKSGLIAMYGQKNGTAIAEHLIKEYENAAVHIPGYVNEKFEVINDIKVKNSRHKNGNIGYFTLDTVQPE